MNKRYVQHVSGIGEKWEVAERIDASDVHFEWIVKAKFVSAGHHYLPKSEYHEVPAPERWERVGPSTIVIVKGVENYLKMNGWDLTRLPSGYRWAWANQAEGTLCIERLVTE